MADYRAIKGLNIQSVSSDNATIQLGDIWYNSTLGKIRVGKTSAAAWASGGNLNIAREGNMGAGTQTSGLTTGGLASDPSPIGAPGGWVYGTETYDGSSWTEVADLNQGRGYAGGCGTQTAALVNGGHYHPVNNPTTTLSEEYDGSSWTEGNNMNTARYAVRDCGTQTSALAAGGHLGPPGYSNSAEEYDGTSWTAGGNLGTARYESHVFGTQTAGACSGGMGAPGGATLDFMEEYDGTSWSEVTNAPRVNGFSSAWGTQTDGITVSGGNPLTAECMTYDGTNWSTTTDYPAATRRLGAATAAPTSAGLAFGGATPSLTTATNEFTGAGVEAANVTTS